MLLLRLLISLNRNQKVYILRYRILLEFFANPVSILTLNENHCLCSRTFPELLVKEEALGFEMPPAQEVFLLITVPVHLRAFRIQALHCSSSPELPQFSYTETAILLVRGS